MEEIKRVELYEKGEDDLLGEMPNWLIHTGSYIFYGIIVLLLVGSAFLSYPDVVTSFITIQDPVNIKWIVSNSSGRTGHLFVADGDDVKVGDTIVSIKSVSLYGDSEFHYSVSESNGKLVIGERWAMKDNIIEGDTICAIMIGPMTHFVGRLTLTPNEVALVQNGDGVTIELYKRPKFAHGNIKGEVVSVRYVPSKKVYAVNVALFIDVETLRAVQLSGDVELCGQASIVTNSRSLLSRFFDTIRPISQ
jgi:hypothetical protein